MASRSTSDFLVAGRNLGVVVCAVVVAAEWLGGMSTIGVSEQAFNTGTLQPILYNIATALGMV
ncbi:MAG: sodium:solute symporter family protein, partial [Candidatus Delongbacteria bacterium]|nr:sodium:solute symporter family protein [Candidatus Delongbacteria bacterium]